MAIKTPEWLRSEELDETGREKVNWWKVLLLVGSIVGIITFIVYLVADMKHEEKEKPIEKVAQWKEPDVEFQDDIVEHPTTTVVPETRHEEARVDSEKKEEKPDPRIEIMARLGNERIKPFAMDFDKVSKFQEFAGANGVGGGCDILPGTTAKLGLERVVNTDGGGVATAILKEPIPGPDGCIAVESGARFTGIVDTSVEFGQNTANIMFTSITTTDNNVVEIEGQAGDAVGSGGVPGEVNRHWGSKLTGVAVSTAVDLAGLALGGGGSGYNIMLGNAGNVLDDFARQFVNRKDTITVDPTKGQQIITVTFTKKIKM